jgi:hypothetical protein
VHWLILLIAIAISLAIATLLVNCAARFLSFIPSATARRWIVITTTLFIIACTIALALILAMVPEDIAEAPRPLIKAYQRLPTVTTLWAATSAVGILAILGLTIYGFLPEKGMPYRPRAASWSLWRTTKRLGLLVALVLVSVVAQDFDRIDEASRRFRR